MYQFEKAYLTSILFFSPDDFLSKLANFCKQIKCILILRKVYHRPNIWEAFQEGFKGLTKNRIATTTPQ